MDAVIFVSLLGRILIIPGVKDEDVEAMKQEIIEIGFHYSSTTVSGGLGCLHRSCRMQVCGEPYEDSRGATG